MGDRVILVVLIAFLYTVGVSAAPECDCNAEFDASVDCPIAYDNTYPELLRLAPDPCNCSCYYTCQQVPHHSDSWTATRQCCASCLLWDQDMKTCVRGPNCGNPAPVDQEPDTGDCPLEPVEGDATKFLNAGHITSCAPGTRFDAVACTCVHANVAAPASPAPKLMTCFTFDNGKSGLFGEWAMYRNVKIVRSGCIHKRCVRFPGGSSSRVEIPYFAGLFGSSKEVSLSFWYKKDEDDMVSLVGNGGCESDTVPSVYVLGLYQGFVQGAMYNGDNGVAYGSKSVPDHEWHHVVMASDGKLMNMYVDGEHVSQEPLKGRLNRSQIPLILGSQPCTDQFYLGHFKGYMDQVCVYSSSLDQEQVNQLYANPGTTKFQ